MKYYKEYQEWLDEIQPLHNGQSYACLLENVIEELEQKNKIALDINEYNQ